MNHRLKQMGWIVLASAAVCGCAGMDSEVPDKYRPLAQLPDEAGKLPVGRVVAVEKITFQRGSRPSTQAAYTSPTIGPAAAATARVFDSIRDTDWVYRHKFRMKGGEIKLIDLKYELAVGDCIAFRPGLQADEPLESRAAVAALPGQCNGL